MTFGCLSLAAQTRRKDWLESLIHHIATVILLLYSYWVNFTRVGVMVLMIHDVSDIFLEAAKLARCAGQGRGTSASPRVHAGGTWVTLTPGHSRCPGRYARKQTLAVAIFAVFTTVWIVTRNIIFPFVIIRRQVRVALFGKRTC